MRELAEIAVACLLALPHDGVEHGGLLIESDAGVVCARQRDGDRDGMRMRIPPDARVVGIYHTHPNVNWRTGFDLFSEPDIEVANRLGVPSYLRAEHDCVKAYETGSPRMNVQGQTVSAGETIHGTCPSATPR